MYLFLRLRTKDLVQHKLRYRFGYFCYLPAFARVSHFPVFEFFEIRKDNRESIGLELRSFDQSVRPSTSRICWLLPPTKRAETNKRLSTPTNQHRLGILPVECLSENQSLLSLFLCSPSRLDIRYSFPRFYFNLCRRVGTWLV